MAKWERGGGKIILDILHVHKGLPYTSHPNVRFDVIILVIGLQL